MNTTCYTPGDCDAVCRGYSAAPRGDFQKLAARKRAAAVARIRPTPVSSKKGT